MNLSYVLRLAGLVLSMAVVSTGNGQTNYYSKSSGSLNLTSTWGTNTDGSGTAPTNFTKNNRIYNIRNQANPTITGNWTVSGTSSKIVVGDGSNACNFVIPWNRSYSGKVDVSNNATLTVSNSTVPSLNTLNANSTVIFNASGNQSIPQVTFGNLTFSGSTSSTMQGSCTIEGDLNVMGSATLTLNNSNSAKSFTVNGSMSVTTSNYIDFGSSGGTSTINLQGNYSQSGAGYMYTSGITSNGTIDFTGTTQTAQQAWGDYVNYTVASGSTVTLNGNFLYGGSGTTYTGTFTVNSGGALYCGTNQVQTDPYLNTTVFTLSGGATLETANAQGISSAGTSGSIEAATNTFSSSANYIYDGSTAQNTGIFTTTPTAGTVDNLTIKNAAGVTLSQSLAVDGTLALTSGVLYTTASTLMTVNNGAGATGASDNSFVDGPISKTGNSAFTFPVGATGVGYVPIGISAPSSTTSTFQAQYFRSSAKSLGLISSPGLDHVSGCDYWMLNRTSGSSAVNVTGYWNANNACGGTYIDDVPKVALAHFSTTLSTWNAYGNDFVTGSVGAGSVTWDNVSSFSPFALGSTSTLNPLPMKLLGFDARWMTGGTVDLSWETSEEVNTDHFRIERSGNGADWATVGTRVAAGSAAVETYYTYTDTDPLPSLDYYRLVLADKDGRLTYSEIKVVSGSGGNSIRIFPNPSSDHLNIDFGAGALAGVVSIRLMNMSGQVLVQKKVVNPAGETVSLPVSRYPRGSYLLQILTPENIRESHVVVIK